MELKQFLERVHAETDELVVLVTYPTGKLLNNGKAEQRGYNKGSFGNFDDAVSAIKTWDKDADTTVYYSIGSFAGHRNGDNKWFRKAEFATKFKTLACDIDVGSVDKGQCATPQEAAKDLLRVNKQLGLPKPLVVLSGNGIHAYWPLSEEISTKQWLLLSNALCAALLEHKLVFDTTKIKDPAMVLRPPQTFHKKQEPWKEVKVVSKGEVTDKMFLAGKLQKWITPNPRLPSAKPKRSSIADAILVSNDVVLDKVVAECKQINALVASGGFTDAANDIVEEPMWRASLGLAKYCTDPAEAVTRLAGRYDGFDLQENLRKLEGWGGTGPTTCSTFEQLCQHGCKGCPYKGNIKSPAQLSSQTVQVVETTEGEEVEHELPEGYVVKDNSIYKEVKVDSQVQDANGNDAVVTTTEWQLISRYRMHVTGIYKDVDSGATTFRLAVKYPMLGWTEEDHEVDVLTSPQNVAKFLSNRQIFEAKSPVQLDKVRIFIMDYLSQVQSVNPTGLDFSHFGWQQDGSFLCGDKVIGGEDSSRQRRLRGAATRFEGVVCTTGTRQGWVDAMKILNREEAKTMRMMMFLAVGSALSGVVGNCTGVVSIYSPKTTTGKTLALHAINSLFGHPKHLLLSKRDTNNSLYKIRGVLNQLPCTIDELSTADAMEAVNYTYDLSSGVEKNSMDQRRELRDPARWTGPTFISTNVGFHQLFDMSQTNDSALRARCIEVIHNDRRLVEKNGKAVSDSDLFFDEIAENHGWAFPELIEFIMQSGGDKVLWKKGRERFIDRFGAPFKAIDKFSEPMIVSGWIMSLVAKKLGLWDFDVNQTAQDWIDHIQSSHDYEAANSVDAIDIVNEFLREHNNEIVISYENDGDTKESIKFPVPDKAVARIKSVYDAKGSLKNGSYIAINIAAFKKWLAKTKDGVDRVSHELLELNALINARERVTLFKGCPNTNPSQAFCLMVNLTHDRYVDALSTDSAVKNSKILQSILGGTNAAKLP